MALSKSKCNNVLHVPVQADQEVPEGLRVHLGVLREVLVVPGVSVVQRFFLRHCSLEHVS